ncbi:MAG TPA: hypothetical protein PLF32_08190 [Bacteroidales bacterium]|nr:hypothetical protein [Bacteroidales bacterium]HOR82621.1 hypothetical protein [Bacteroidales bacterium]HPJ91778.1 hypothetical protein [Bacteroidales bacterium]
MKNFGVRNNEVRIGYAFGIINKVLCDFDIVTFLWAFNMLLVSVDLFLYYKYIKIKIN